VALLMIAVSFVFALPLCALLIPLFRRLFLVAPGARSSHVQATPQGGGLVVVPVAIVVAFAALAGARGTPVDGFACSLLASLAILLALGAWDDLAHLNAGLRLLVQVGAAAFVLVSTPIEFAAHIPFLAPFVVAVCVLFAMVWFINLTNFMDGIDLMSVTQFVPAFATVALLLGRSTGPALWVDGLCLASVGALLGFSLLNKPRARLFLGDSGSVPLGLLGATAIVVLIDAHGIAVAVLPFLYYIADSSLTLARRILAGEKFWQAHRDHFYQRATRRGLSTWGVIGRVAACNAVLCALAWAAAGRTATLQGGALALGAAAVALLMRDLVRERL
jgi:UDP-N-acetylmuramyl pentapeptide phosphotransferase/UDP-N-acetylglucosamine-1-phosphate transferase